MTENETIKELHAIRPRGGIIPQKRAEALDVAIKALEEIQQYRAIGTVEECRAAVEKQIAQKPKKKFIHEVCGLKMKDETNLCPRCNGFVFGYSYCNACGQKIKQEW